MNKLAYYQGYMDKEAEGYGNILRETIGGGISDALAGAVKVPTGIAGAVTGLMTKGVLPQDIDKEDQISSIAPGLGAYRLIKRIGSTRRDEEGKTVPGATGNIVSEQTSMLNPLNVLGGLPGAVMAAATKSRTPDEQREHDKNVLKNVLMNAFVPGAGTYNASKRLGSTVKTSDKDDRIAKAKANSLLKRKTK